MSEPFIGEIRLFAGNFAPRGWAFCDGQLLAVSQNDALFSLLGTIYGGDGRTTFGLPDLRSRVPVHAGVGPGLSTRRLGQKLGSDNLGLPTRNTTNGISTERGVAVNQTTQALGTPRGMPGNPALGLNFIIALFGIYPSRF